mmetsp:Transcript_50941/g.99886  ORF Transcript_50941/g.99886 Transcript_50941/m.99886 type:complete len:1054 (-) Transcript_50941:348-3509(-)|eukprot:CAMPEP_0175128420 /NCGR_PEP_ID=MMETSP0087-20121206/4917_1 /TAXON_ID=136419 /ORGANISM="Unknown Unknown, Strain D1" /LENGTH=1053 /DNA_ID=CAMNT_0016410477 /DNA_START=39 /DNA_END=3200 /DNA_ORIENTATION=+
MVNQVNEGDLVQVVSGKYRGKSGQVKRKTPKQVVVELGDQQVRLARTAVNLKRQQSDSDETEVPLGKRARKADKEAEKKDERKDGGVKEDLPPMKGREEDTQAVINSKQDTFPAIPSSTDPYDVRDFLEAALGSRGVNLPNFPSDLAALCTDYCTQNVLELALANEDQIDYLDGESYSPSNGCSKPAVLCVMFTAIKRCHTKLFRTALANPTIQQMAKDGEISTWDDEEMVDDEDCVRLNMIQHAAETDSAECAGLLMEAFPDCPAGNPTWSDRETHGMTAFHMAAWFSSADTLKVMVEKFQSGVFSKHKSWWDIRREGDKKPETEEDKKAKHLKEVLATLNQGTNAFYGWQSYCTSDMEVSPLCCALLGPLAGAKLTVDRLEKVYNCVKTLLEAGVDVNKATGPISAGWAEGPHSQGVFSEGPANRWSSMTALHLAVLLGSPDIVSDLVAHGAVQSPVVKEAVPLKHPTRSTEAYWLTEFSLEDVRKNTLKTGISCRRLWLPVHLAAAAVTPSTLLALSEGQKAARWRVLDLLLPEKGKEIVKVLPKAGRYTECVNERFNDEPPDNAETVEIAYQRCASMVTALFPAVLGADQGDVEMIPQNSVAEVVSEELTAWEELQQKVLASSPPPEVVQLVQKTGEELCSDGILDSQTVKTLVYLVATRLKTLARAAVQCAHNNVEPLPEPEVKDLLFNPFPAINISEELEGELVKHALCQVLKPSPEIDETGSALPALLTGFSAGSTVKEGCKDHPALKVFCKVAVYLFEELLELSNQSARDLKFASVPDMSDLPEECQFKPPKKEGDEEEGDDDDKHTVRQFHVMLALKGDEELRTMFLPTEKPTENIPESKEATEAENQKRLLEGFARWEFDSVVGLREWAKTLLLEKITTESFIEVIGEEKFDTLPRIAAGAGLDNEERERVLDNLITLATSKKHYELSETKDVETFTNMLMSTFVRTAQAAKKLLQMKGKLLSKTDEVQAQDGGIASRLLEFGDLAQQRGGQLAALRAYEQVLVEVGDNSKLSKLALLGKGEIFCNQGEKMAAVSCFDSAMRL